ncbi:MAG: sigma-70 family RNA polymerase sigma factor [Rhodospirillaceae bacterium]|nr:sigma-70 family RNA polymerase sigma factor [Rhodospirillaceae bacterium]
MRVLWQSLHTSFVQSSELLSFQNQFNAVRQPNDALQDFIDPCALLDHLHSKGDRLDEKNQILAALVTTAQEVGPAQKVATTMLWLALWPGLDALYRRLLRYFLQHPEDLVSEISDQFSKGIQCLDLNRVNRIAATLILNVEREIRTSLKASWVEAGLRDVMPDEQSEPQPSCVFALPDGIGTDEATALLTNQLEAWIGDDASLVISIAIHGNRQHEAGDDLGISAEAARKRYQRATRLLQKKIKIIL